MPSRAENALKWSLLLEYGLPVEREVITWADAEIQASGSPADALLDLCTVPLGHKAEILSHLHSLASGADLWTALRAAVPRLYQHLVTKPFDAERIAAGLYRTVEAADDVPKEFHFAYRFDDDFSLAHQGMAGHPDVVRLEFMKVLMHFIPAA
jgi:hypothetical protein